MDDPYASLGTPVDQTAQPPQPPGTANESSSAQQPPDPYAQVGSEAAVDQAATTAPDDAPDELGFTDEQKKQILAYLPTAMKAADPVADLERYSLELSGGKSKIGNAKDVVDELKGGTHPEAFAFTAPTVEQPQPKSTAEQLVDNTVNDLAGIGQGAAALPDMAASGVGKILSIVPNLIGQGLEAAGHTDAAKWIQDNITHNLANPAQVGDVIEGAVPTPDTTEGHVDRLIGQLLGGSVTFPQAAAETAVKSLVGDAPKLVHLVPNPVPIADDAAQAGIRVLTSDVRPPRTFMGKAAQAIGERIPITGTGGTREAQQAERIAAVKNLAQEYGVQGDALASPLVADVAKDLAATRGAALEKLTAQKNGVIDKIPGAVPMPQTVAAIDQQIARLQGINSDAYAPVISKLETFRDQLSSGKTLSQIEGNRKLLGDMFSDPNLASIRSDGEKAINALYDPLRSDMGAFIKANGEAGDFPKWKSANDQLAGMVGQLKNTALKTALSTADATPENVARLLFSSKPSDVQLLYNNLSPAGRAKAQAAVIQRAVEKAGGLENVSPDRFASQVKGMGNQVGILFSDNSARLNGLARVLSMTQRASQAAVAPPTGVQAVPYAMGVGFTQLFGLPGGIAAAAGAGLLARAYESAPVRNILLKLGRTKAGTPQEAMMLKRASAAINAALKKHVPEAANSNTLSSAAAQPQEDEQNQ